MVCRSTPYGGHPMDTSELITIPVGIPFQQKTGIGRSRQFELIAKGDLESVMVGRRRLIIVSSYHAYLDRLRQRERGEGKRLPSPNPRARQRQDQAEPE